MSMLDMLLNLHPLAYLEFANPIWMQNQEPAKNWDSDLVAHKLPFLLGAFTGLQIRRCNVELSENFVGIKSVLISEYIKFIMDQNQILEVLSFLVTKLCLCT